jgi:acyl-CoA hydrolase
MTECVPPHPQSASPHPESSSPRPVSASQSERAEIIFPGDANPLGNLFGGRLMQFIDLVGALAASRHSRAIPVTVSMDHLDFVAPVKIGDVLILKASVNRAFNTSMEVGVKAMVENVYAQTLHHVSSAYLTFIALDTAGHRVALPQIIPETDHQRRRYEDAGRRRDMRSGEMLRRKDLRATLAPEWHV